MLGHELLLRTALLDGNDALQAWESWCASADLNHVDAASYWLLPLVHRNLRTLGVEHPYMDRLKGVRRRTWLSNQVNVRALADALIALEKRDVATVVPRWVTGAAGEDSESGLRPIEVCEALVREPHASDAASILETHGWRRLTPSPRRLTPRFRAFRGSILLRNAGGIDLRLHWHVLPRCAAADDEFWNHTEPAAVQGAETRTLAPTGQFLQTCLTGIEWSFTPAVWWIVDALTTLQGAAPVDTGEILRFVSRYRLVLPMLRAVEYLQAVLDVTELGELESALSAESLSRADRYEYESIVQPWRRRSALASLTGAWRHHARSGTGAFAAHLTCSLRWAILPRAIARLKGQPLID